MDFFCDSNYHSFCPHSARKWLLVWIAIMIWVAEAEGWCWWDLWTPWPPSPGFLQEVKAYLHVLGQQKSLQRCLRCATQNAESFYGLVWSYCVELPGALLSCNSIIACAKAIQDVQLEDMGCSVGEYNINALEPEDKMCNSKEWEEDSSTPWEQDKKQRKVRNRRRKGREEKAVDEEGTTYKAGTFSTTFWKYSFG